jgi:hypothetical protein
MDSVTRFNDFKNGLIIFSIGSFSIKVPMDCMNNANVLNEAKRELFHAYTEDRMNG